MRSHHSGHAASMTWPSSIHHDANPRPARRRGCRRAGAQLGSSRPGGEQRSPCTPPVAHGSVPSKGPSVLYGAQGRDGSCPCALRLGGDRPPANGSESGSGPIGATNFGAIV
jgi:hypothetical protein